MGEERHNNPAGLIMFKNAVRKTCVYPIIVFAYLTIKTGIGFLNNDFFCNNHSWQEFFELPFYFSQVLNVVLIVVGAIHSLKVFDFSTSKKKSNVVFSLGLKKSKIYLSNILGGIIPMTLAFIIPAVLEIVSCKNNIVYDSPHTEYHTFVLQFAFFNIATYIFSYVVFSSVIACSNNKIAGMVFASVIFMLPTGLLNFIYTIYTQLTPGASSENLRFLFEKWNWGIPYIFGDFYTSYISNNNILSIYPEDFPESVQWTGSVTCLVYSVIVILIGVHAFKNHKNENIETWGKSKFLTEFCAVVSGIYAITLLPTYYISTYLGQKVLSIVLIFAVFCAVYFLFQFVFGKKQKKAAVSSIKRLAVYVLALAGCFAIFLSNFFGLSTPYISPEDVTTVSLRSPFYLYCEQYIYCDSFLGLQSQGLPHNSKYQKIEFINDDEINAVVDVYNQLLKESAKSSSKKLPYNCEVEYTITLNDGREVTNYFSAASEESIKALLALNDLTTLKNSFLDEYSKSYDNKEYNKGYFSEMVNSPIYFFGKDMTKGVNIGTMTTELYDAIKKDLLAQTAENKFCHTADDELGLLIFSLDQDYSGYYEYEDDDENLLDIGSSSSSSGDIEIIGEYEEENYTPPEVIDNYSCSAWNLDTYNMKSLVLTKDMQNTVAYLKERGFDKNFQNSRSVETIKSVKLATPTELFKKNVFPIFCAAYWSADMVADGFKELQRDDYWETYYFGEIEDSITDKKQIEALVNSSVLYGCYSNDSKIMEITYDDGAIATVMVAADAVK